MIKPNTILLAAAAVLSIGACNSGGERNAKTAGGDSTEAPVKPPANGDWTTIVTPTSAGGYRMGNPNADVKLVEFGSMTCPHCAAFDQHAFEPLSEQYVKTGKVSFEFRNYVRDPFDIAASLIARCNGAKSVFPLTNALYKDQKMWVAKLQEAPKSELEGLQNLGPDQQFLKIAQLADLQKWAAMRGVPTAKSTTCLTNQEEVNTLVQMTSDATSDYPDFAGTPTFILNGKMVELGPVAEDQVWSALESKIKAALGG